MELTAAQRSIIEHEGGPLRVTGGPACGKTTALVARYRRVVGTSHRAGSVLVVCPNRAAATRFRDAVLPHIAGGFDTLPITTWWGVAFDLVTRGGGPVRLLSTGDQRALVSRLLTAESPADWPEYGHYLGRQAFTDEVATALVELGPGACAELDRFAERYRAVLDDRGEVDRRSLFERATALATDRYAHVLVDDHSELGGSLLAALTPTGTGAVVVTNGPLPWPAADIAAVTLTQDFRHQARPALITCHPSTEPEAIAGELLAARAEGVAWSSMAVLVRSPHHQARAIARALSRHGIPVAPGPGLGTGAGDAAVAAIVDVLRWVAGDADAPARLLQSPLAATNLTALHDAVAWRAAAATPATLAFTIWTHGLGHLISGTTGDDASLDAVVAFLGRLERRAEQDPNERLPGLLAALEVGEVEPDPWRASTVTADPAAVTVTSIAAAAGREWHTVVVAGCVEGQLPRIRGRSPLFDPTPVSPAERRQASLAAERALFIAAVSRATSRLIGTAAPAPGVLLSRFVEDWERRSPRPPAFRSPALTPRRSTQNDVAIFPDGRLVLSASQLSTYDDCPLRYAYQYGLRVRDDAGSSAALGTLVHEVLAEFLRPGRDGGHTREHLLALAADAWTDDIARYRPQIEECRRDYYAMLDTWWTSEGEGLDPAQVLAVEHRFDIEVSDIEVTDIEVSDIEVSDIEVSDLRLVGAIDRIDRTADGIRIIDYKTGKTEPRANAMADDIQLAVYHLAATLDPALVAFGPPRGLQLLYLRTMHAFEQPILTDHAQATVARVLAAAADIRAERFEPSVDAACRNCTLHRLCPLQRAGREVGVG